MEVSKQVSKQQWNWSKLTQQKKIKIVTEKTYKKRQFIQTI
jgi:hypothetical protein